MNSNIGDVWMTVKFDKNGGITFTMNPPCYYFSCANCPYRRGYLCFYKEIKNGDV